MVPAASARIPRVPAYSGFVSQPNRLPVRGCHPLRPRFPARSGSLSSHSSDDPTTPRAPQRPRFGLRPLRSPLLRASTSLSSPAGTKMFQFPAFAPASPPVSGPSAGRVPPFGHRRISSRLRIPAAFRSLPRPSSPPDSQGILRSLFLPFSSPALAPPSPGVSPGTGRAGLSCSRLFSKTVVPIL